MLSPIFESWRYYLTFTRRPLWLNGNLITHNNLSKRLTHGYWQTTFWIPMLYLKKLLELTNNLLSPSLYCFISYQPVISYNLFQNIAAPWSRQMVSIFYQWREVGCRWIQLAQEDGQLLLNLYPLVLNNCQSELLTYLPGFALNIDLLYITRYFDH